MSCLLIGYGIGCVVTVYQLWRSRIINWRRWDDWLVAALITATWPVWSLLYLLDAP